MSGYQRVFSALDVLPAEEAGIDGPGAGPDYGQRSTENRQQYMNPGVASMRQYDPHLSHGDRCAGQRGPEAYQKKCPQARPHRAWVNPEPQRAR